MLSRYVPDVRCYPICARYSYLCRISRRWWTQYDIPTTSVGPLRPHKRVSKYRVTAFGYVLKPTSSLSTPVNLRSAPHHRYLSRFTIFRDDVSLIGQSATRSKMSNPQVSILMSRRRSLHRVKNVPSAQPRCHLRFPPSSLGLLIASRHVP